MYDLPLNGIRAFAAVYETGGIRPAARHLRISHSSVSRSVRELEDWLGVALLEKRAGQRTLSFTPQGETLGKAGLAGLRQWEGAVLACREARSFKSATIATTPSFAARWLMARLPDFNHKHPTLELSVMAEQTMTDLSRNEVDLCIRMGNGPWPQLSCEPLMDDVLFPVMQPELWEAKGRPKRLEQFVAIGLLHDRDPNASWERWRHVHATPGLGVHEGPRFTSSDLLLRAASRGMGVALAYGKLVADDLASGLLIRPCGDEEIQLRNAYWLVMSEAKSRRTVDSIVIAWLKSQINTDVATLPLI